jgi:RimJ/RimL family protein N-acetyltransferase
MIPQLESFGYATYTLIRKSDHRKIGTCGLYDREGLEGIDLGFALLPQYEKNGFATEALNKLMDAAFNEFGLEVISAITSKDNLSSQKILEKLGFKFKGMKRLPTNKEELRLYKKAKEAEPRC